MNITDEARQMLGRCLHCKEMAPGAGLVCVYCHLDLQDVARRAAGRHWSRNGPYLNRA